MAATCIEVPYRVRSNGGGQEERKRLAASRGGRMKWSSEEKHGRATVEDKEKHRKHIDAILKAWESLIAKDKEERHAKLREKVELQRQLISKVQEQNEAMRYYKMEKKKEKEEMEQLAVELEMKERKKSTYKTLITKRLKSSISAPMIQFTNNHINNDTREHQTTEAKRGSTAPISSTAKSPLTSYIRIPHVDSINEDSTGGGPASPVMFQFPENKVLQYLGMEQNHTEQVKIEDMWLHMKSHSEKQLHPMQEHLERLKMISCPSVKECLEVYDQPTACDNYTGKTISLTAALKNLRTISEPTKEYTLRLSKSSASLKSKCGQQMIESTSKKRPDRDEIGNNGWFVGLDKRRGQRPQSAPAPLLVSKKATPLETGPAAPVKTRATSARTYCIGGYERRGSIKKPLTSWSQRRNSSKSMKGGSTVSKSTTAKQRVAVVQNNVTFPNHWEPLSLTALGEANGVLKREGSGHGEFRNGRVTLWKQSST